MATREKNRKLIGKVIGKLTEEAGEDYFYSKIMATREKNRKLMEESRKLTEELEENSKKFWLKQFAKHGYSKIEEDNNPEEWYETSPDNLPDNPEWVFVAKGRERISKKLIFWKEKGKDGIVEGGIEHENECRKKNYWTNWYSIGTALHYFNDLYKNQKESRLRKFLRFGKEKKLFASCLLETITVNGKKYGAQMIISEKGFENILMH